MTHHWHCRERLFEIGTRPLLMGIVNVTPDSFSDGGQHDSVEAAVAHGLRLVSEGADILDIGGESSRPGAVSVSLEEERRRVIPVVEELLKSTTTPLSVDTIKAPIAREALQRGASIINDITALGGDSEMVAVVRAYRAGLVLMHMRGTPATMQENVIYEDVVAEVGRFLQERLSFALAAGIDERAVALDPGIGFGKAFADTLKQLRALPEYQRFGRPICLGVSRKGFIGMITGRPRSERAFGSVAVACRAAVQSSAQIFRVHDVAAHRDALNMIAALNDPVG